LPVGELDLPVVLAARPVLGKRLRPALARRDHAHAAMHAVWVLAHAARQQREHDRGRAVFDDLRIRGVADDDELVVPVAR
jgi:hypothetical protein